VIDRKHISAIADSARTLLQSRRKFLRATLNGRGTQSSDARYFKYECSLGELRRLLAAAGYFTKHRRSFDTEEEMLADAALHTLAKEIGERPKAPLTASTPVPLLGETSAALLAEVLKDVEEFLRPAPVESTATLAETEQYVTLDQAAAIVNRTKRTLRRRLNAKNSAMPRPDVDGGGGKPDEWKWSALRPWLESEFGKRLPTKYPSRR
jgi:hypothetical protein